MRDLSDMQCPCCGGPMAGLHCKLICANCGYREDCSDLFPHRPPVTADEISDLDPQDGAEGAAAS